MLQERLQVLHVRIFAERFPLVHRHLLAGTPAEDSGRALLAEASGRGWIERIENLILAPSVCLRVDILSELRSRDGIQRARPVHNLIVAYRAIAS